MESMDEYMEWIHSTWNPPGMWGQGKLLAAVVPRAGSKSVLKSEGGAQAQDSRRVQGMRGGYGRREWKGGGVRRDSQNGLQGAQLLLEPALWGDPFLL